MTKLTELDRLYQVADDYEAQVLDALRRRAGLTWEHEECWTNAAERKTCERCGQRRTTLEARGEVS